MAWLVKEHMSVQARRFFQNLEGPQVFTCAGKECARTCSSKDPKELGSNVSALCAISCLFFWLCFFLPPLLGEELAEELDDDEPDDDELPEEPSGGLSEDRAADPLAFVPEASAVEASAVEASPAFDADGSVSVSTSASETSGSGEGGAWSEEEATQESAADSATSEVESAVDSATSEASEDTSTSLNSSEAAASEPSESDPAIGRPRAARLSLLSSERWLISVPPDTRELTNHSINSPGVRLIRHPRSSTQYRSWKFGSRRQ